MGGIIKWFGLEKFWNSLSDKTKQQIKEKERKSLVLSTSFDQEYDSPIDSGEILYTSETKSQALREMGIGLEISESEKILWMAYEEAKTLSDKHYALLALSNAYYRYRDNPEYLEKCIQVCQMDIDLYPKIKKSHHFGFIGYDGKRREPNYPSFERLAIIYEKQGDYQSAIAVTEKCIELGASVKTDPFRRLEKLKKRLSQQEGDVIGPKNPRNRPEIPD